MLRRCAPLLAVALLGSLAACGGTAPSPQPSAPYHWTGATLVHALPKPDFTMTDQHGQQFDFLHGTQGRVTLLYFGYTHCPDICPEDMAMLAFALRQLPADVRSRVAVVFVTTDPARDTPPVLASWLGDFNAGFIGLTGTKAQLDTAQAEARVSFASAEPATPGAAYYVDHAAEILCYTTDDQAHIAFLQGMPAAGVAGDLRRLVTDGWTGAGH